MAAHNQNTVISSEGEEVIGNDANRFDTWRQTTTLGPTPPTDESGPPETASGSAGPVPRS